jgi:hypothetical protein
VEKWNEAKCHESPHCSCYLCFGQIELRHKSLNNEQYPNGMDQQSDGIPQVMGAIVFLVIATGFFMKNKNFKQPI